MSSRKDLLWLSLIVMTGGIRIDGGLVFVVAVVGRDSRVGWVGPASVFVLLPRGK